MLAAGTNGAASQLLIAAATLSTSFGLQQLILLLPHIAPAGPAPYSCWCTPSSSRSKPRDTWSLGQSGCPLLLLRHHRTTCQPLGRTRQQSLRSASSCFCATSCPIRLQQREGRSISQQAVCTAVLWQDIGALAVDCRTNDQDCLQNGSV